MQRAVVNGASGEVELVDLDAAEIAELEAVQQVAATQEAVATARTADLTDRRDTVRAELAALGAAVTWPAAKGPLLRVLVFILRRLGERDD